MLVDVPVGASPADGACSVATVVIPLLPLPIPAVRGEQEKVRCRERLGGLLKHYDREAA
jgi:hypothetical protein